MDGIRWISMTMSERILIMVKNKVVLKERDAWSDLANFIGEMVAKYAESMELDNLPDPDFYLRMLPSEHLHGTHRIFAASQNGKCHLMDSPLPREK